MSESERVFVSLRKCERERASTERGGRESFKRQLQEKASRESFKRELQERASRESESFKRERASARARACVRGGGGVCGRRDFAAVVVGDEI